MMTWPEWLAAAATIAGALLTGANIGTRVTGWGFVVFAIGSVAWVTAGVIKGLPSLIATDGILLLANVFGAWRWLGRKSRHEESSERAAARSRRAPVPTLFPAGSLIGARVEGPDGKSRGEVVEAMMKCEDRSLAYVVVGEGGVAGAGETLRILAPKQIRLRGDSVACDLDDAAWKALPTIEDDQWPAEPPQSPQPAAGIA